jgi:hypothetical protein
MTDIIDALQATSFSDFIDDLIGLLTWMLDTVIGIFTGLSDLIGYATAQVNSLVSVFTSNSGVMTMVNDVWSAVPGAFKALVILSIIMSAVLVMVRRA